jgi:hypothetical protein
LSSFAGAVEALEGDEKSARHGVSLTPQKQGPGNREEEQRPGIWERGFGDGGTGETWTKETGAVVIICGQ